MSNNSSPNLIQRLAQLGLKITGWLAFLAPLLTRLVVGVTFYFTGHGKLGGLDKLTGFFSDLGIPFPGANAVFIATLEFVGGICLILGLGTRIFSFLLSCTMVVALLTADKDTLIMKFPADLTDVTSFTLLLFLIWLVLYGPGPVSVDYLLSKWLGLNRKEEPAPLVGTESSSTASR
jgi:putative oxidoreductase